VYLSLSQRQKTVDPVLLSAEPEEHDDVLADVATFRFDEVRRRYGDRPENRQGWRWVI
jgi:hypothetical protein